MSNKSQTACIGIKHFLAGKLTNKIQVLTIWPPDTPDDETENRKKIFEKHQ